MSDIPDDAPIHRRVSPLHLGPDGRPSSAAFQNFDEQNMSCENGSICTPRETFDRSQVECAGVVGFTAGFARSLKQAVQPLPEFTNEAHVHVSGKKGRSTRRKFSREAGWLVDNRDGEDPPANKSKPAAP